MPKKADLDAAIRRGKEQEKIRKQQAVFAAAGAAKTPPLVERLPEAPKPKKEKKPKKKYDADARDRRVADVRGRMVHGTRIVKVWNAVHGVWEMEIVVPTGDDTAPWRFIYFSDGSFRGEEAMHDRYREYLKSKDQPPPAG
jgi:hypothetical protein